ncbi:MAG: DUF2232 domain-containing protein [Sphaerochaetaceae bacterium]|nr:DUF2232 domain-containing protein [Sphaerochaetaceae bacterium]
MQWQTNDTVRYVGIPVLASIVIYVVSSSAFLSILPLLLVFEKVQPVRKFLYGVAAVILFVIGFHAVQLANVLQDGQNTGLLIVGLYTPLSMLVASGIWIATYGRKNIERFFYSISFAVVAGFAMLIWLLGNSASASRTLEVYNDILSSFMTVFVQQQVQVMSAQELGAFVGSVIGKLGLPFITGQFGLALLISEVIKRRNSPSLEQSLVHWSIPHQSIWVLLSGMSAVLISYVADSVLLENVAYNITGVVALLYAVQGLSIATYLLKRKFEQIRVVRMFFLGIVLMILPGANVVFIIALPLLGVSETWITYRKNE